MDRQKTISRPATFEGIGLHFGASTRIIFKPALENTGVRFIRTDLSPFFTVEANLKNVIGVVRGTTLGSQDFHIHTVEHILAALCGLGIDNVIVEISGYESPVGDGSSLPFVKVIKEAGIVQQNEPKKYFIPTSHIVYQQEDGAYLKLLPSDDFQIECEIQYPNALLKSQKISLTLTPEVFEKEIASARTFCFDYEIEYLKKKGLAKGGTLENTVVVGEKKVHNPSLRYEDEFVRHKVLDILGDLQLLGMPVKGKLIAFKPGHKANIAFTKLLEERIKPKGFKIERKEEIKLEEKILDAVQIQQVIPHRPPFLLVDKVVIQEPEKKAVGFKNVSIGEPFFQGHFPGRPIMPGVLIVEAMAQTACVLFLSRPDLAGKKIAFFLGIDNCRFRKPVIPGDLLRLELEIVRPRVRGGKCQGKAYVGDEFVCEAEILFSLVDK